MTNLEHRPGTAVIELSSGEQLDLRNPEPHKITVPVIAHHLANVCRFAGAVRRTYSVGEHTLLVAAYMEYMGCSVSEVLSGLHHDDAEFILGDMTRPLKERITEFKPIESEFMEVIAQALNFSSWGINVALSTIKEADNWALAAEAYYLMPSRGRNWWSWGLFDPDSDVAQMLEVIGLRMDNMPHGITKKLWIQKHLELLGRITPDMRYEISTNG